MKQFLIILGSLFVLLLFCYLAVGSDAGDVYRAYNELSEKRTTVKGKEDFYVDWVDNSYTANNSNESEDKNNVLGNLTENGGTSYNASLLSNHNHRAFYQFSNEAAGLVLNPSISSNGALGSTVKTSGCGFCSTAAVMASFGYEKTLSEWHNYYTNRGINLSTYWPPSDKDPTQGVGMMWSWHAAASKVINEDGSMGQYRIIVNDSIATGDAAAFENMVKTYLADDTRIMVSAASGMFTNGGHVIVIVDYTDSNKDKIHIIDSSTVAKNKLGMSWEDAQKFAWPVNSNERYNGYVLNNSSYCIWHYCVIQKTG